MGQSTDAILTYGIQFEEEGTDAHDVCVALQDERYDEHTKAEKELDVSAVSHCSNSCPMYVVGVVSLTKRAWRGSPVEIKPELFIVNEDECREKIKAFCDRFGLPFDAEKCGWWLQSDWS